MTIWWEGLTLIQRIFALTAIPATVFLVLQTILLVFGLAQGGGDADGGGDHDFDGDHSFDGDHDFDCDGDCDCGGDCDFDGDGHFDGDHDHDSGGGHDPGLRIFTVRAFVAFFSVFGWLGLALSRDGFSDALSLTLSILAGLAAMVIMAWILKSMLKLQSSGNANIKDAVGKSGTVYIRVPAYRQGVGKVTLVVSGRFSEADAVTDADETLLTGSSVTVISVSNQNILCVIPKK